VFFAGLFAEIVVLCPFGFGQDRADDLESGQCDAFSNVFVHGVLLFLWVNVFGNPFEITAVMASKITH